MSTPLEVFNQVTKEGASGSEPQELTLVSGSVPPELSGVVYRAGPGRLRSNGVDYDHLFDGDGFLQRFAVREGRINYRSRYVETPAFRLEAARGRPLYRSFGTNLPGGLIRNAFRASFKNAANTTPLLIAGDLLALWEGGAPHAVDPETLEYRGRWLGDGALASRTLVERMMGNGRPFSAHAKTIPGSAYIYNFGLSPGLVQRLLLYKVHAETGAVDTQEVRLPRLTFIHDFVATADGTRIFFDVSVAFHLAPALAGLIPPAASVRGDAGSPTIVRVFGPDGSRYTITAPGGYVFHLPNGYREDDRLVVDTCWMERFPDADDFTAMLNDAPPAHPFRPTLTRHFLDPASGTHESAALSAYPLELPSINPAVRGQRHRYIWGVAEPPDRPTYAVTHGIAKVDTVSGETRFADHYPFILGEPLFVPGEAAGQTEHTGTPAGRGGTPAGTAAGAPAEDGGYLFVLAFDPEGRRGLLLVLRADTLDEVARLELPEPVHPGFHGIWVPE